MHKLDFYSVLKFIAFLWDLSPSSHRHFPPSPHPQTGSARSIKRLKLWSTVRLLGKSMQNMPETSLKSAYTIPWVKSTAAWHCRLIRSKMKWSFPEDCPCHVLTNPRSILCTLGDLKPNQPQILSQTCLCKALLALGNTARQGQCICPGSLLKGDWVMGDFLQKTYCFFSKKWRQRSYQ